jgi:methylated-DNA-[protein]-cysteine S-methyltransferase
MTETYCTYKTAFGNVIIASDGSAISAVQFEKTANRRGKKAASELTDKAAKQLEEYVCGKRQRFALPLRPSGTAFQHSVWKALLSIPYGETKSYKQVAELLGKPNASRAVGLANSKNPIWIIIPCHRVIGSNGALVGYAGGLKTKQKLLELEKNFS